MSRNLRIPQTGIPGIPAKKQAILIVDCTRFT